jgi:hypothetical protein
MPAPSTTPPPPAAPTTSRPAGAQVRARWPRLASRLKVRHRLAALGVVGALMCALPLIQVLRYQAAALGDTQAAQAALDPLEHAVALQRGLVQHRDVAGAVLRGASAREPERRQRQRVVNERLTDLDLSLRRGSLQRATQEGEALREDWTALSRRVEERSVAAADSDAAHRLLVEQTLQVIDYVSLAALGVGGQAGPEAQAWMQPLLHTLPRLSARLGLLTSAPAASAETHPRELAAAQLRLVQVLSDLQALPAAEAAAGPAGTRAAMAALQRQADGYFELQRNSAADEPLRAAAAALAEADAALFTRARAQLAAGLASRVDNLTGQRSLLLASLALLGALGAVLGLSLLPPRPPGARRRASAPALRRFNAADPSPPDSRPADAGLPSRAPERSEARRLLQRLREPGARSARAPQDPGSIHTLPPED